MVIVSGWLAVVCFFYVKIREESFVLDEDQPEEGYCITWYSRQNPSGGRGAMALAFSGPGPRYGLLARAETGKKHGDITLKLPHKFGA